MRFSPRAVAVVGTMAMVLSTAVVAAPAGAAPTPAPTKTYKACANKDTGAIRLVVKGKKCKKSEIKLSWNVQGPAGMAGPVGPQGPTGPQGATGATGPQGATGAQGPAGSSAVPIPSGTTVVGIAGYDGHTVNVATGTDLMWINLPGDAGKVLTAADVKFKANAVVNAGSVSASCTGTFTAPTAPSGKVCLYVAVAGGIAAGTVTSGPGGFLPRNSFFVQWSPDTAAVNDEFLTVTWAYTAP